MKLQAILLLHVGLFLIKLFNITIKIQNNFFLLGLNYIIQNSIYIYSTTIIIILLTINNLLIASGMTIFIFEFLIKFLN